MPIYEYQCDDCGALYEVFQKMSDEPLTECEACGGHLHKVLHPVAIHFKGSGFYTTDYGKGSGRRSVGRESGDSETPPSSDGGTSGDGNSPGSTDKPAAGSKAKEKTRQAT